MEQEVNFQVRKNIHSHYKEEESEKDESEEKISYSGFKTSQDYKKVQQFSVLQYHMIFNIHKCMMMESEEYHSTLNR